MTPRRQNTEPDDIYARFAAEGEAKVLVVDDSAFQRSRLRDLLEVSGYIVKEASNGEDALDRLSEGDIDLIVLDVVMPGLDGYQVCERVKSHPTTRFIPVIIVTSLKSKEDRIYGIEAGADEYLRVPWSSLELLARVRTLLRTKRLLDRLETSENVVRALVRAIEAKDRSTLGHSERVATLAYRVARQLRCREEATRALLEAGRLHDVGKIGVSESVLLKPGPLTLEEKIEVQRHPLLGEEICQPLQFAAPVLDLIRHHHERLNGSGYPDGIAGPQLSPLVRILGIADAFDAMVNDRPYRKAMKWDEAFRILRESPEKWDQDVLGAFETMIHSTREYRELSIR